MKTKYVYVLVTDKDLTPVVCTENFEQAISIGVADTSIQGLSEAVDEACYCIKQRIKKAPDDGHQDWHQIQMDEEDV